MNIIKTAIPGVLIVEPKVFGDARGFFMELYHEERYGGGGIAQRFVQDSPADELVLRWNDPQLGIDWGCDSPKVSARDSGGASLAQLVGRLPRYEAV
jgi:dTDP-4-dehydrorhamnose 3,5-epimerase-like enzyme